jgi:hypothetical protein
MKKVVIYDPVEYCNVMAGQLMSKDENVFIWNKEHAVTCLPRLVKIFESDWSVLHELFTGLLSPIVSDKLFVIWRDE